MKKARKTGAFVPWMARGEPASPAVLAERVGFEPTVQFPAHTLSKRAP
jgi:hypothetical protein